jgi:hypothetical protein
VEASADEGEGNTAEIARQIPPDTGIVNRPVIEAAPESDVAMDEAGPEEAEPESGGSSNDEPEQAN